MAGLENASYDFPCRFSLVNDFVGRGCAYSMPIYLTQHMYASGSGSDTLDVYWARIGLRS